MALPRISLERMGPHTSNSHLLAYLMGALLIFAFIAWELAHCSQIADANTSPPPAEIIESRDLVMLPPNIVPVQPTPPWAYLADVIYRVPSSGRLSGELTEALASRMASAIWEHADALTPYGMVGLAWFESGFKTSASSPSGRHHGLFQRKDDEDPEDIPGHTERTCDGLRVWKEKCARLHRGEHDWLAHHFGGEEPSPRALLSARIVRWRAAKLRETGRTE